MERIRFLPKSVLYCTALLLAWIGFSALSAATASRITLIVDGQPRKVQVHATSVGMALLHSGIYPGPGDVIFPPVHSPLEQVTILEVRRARWFWLEVDGEWRQVQTAAQSPAAALLEAGIQLLPGDRVWVDGIPVADPSQPFARVPQRLRFARGRAIEVFDGGERSRARGSGGTLGDLLASAGWTLYEGDRAEPGLADLVPEEGRVILERSREIKLMVEGRLQRARVVATSVGEALAGAGVLLLGLDRTEPAEGEPLPAEGVIRVIRGREEVVLEQEPIPFPVTYQAAPDLEIDQQALLEPGTMGVRARQVRVLYEDEQEVARVVENEWVAKEPEPRVVGYGTKIVIRTLTTPDGTIEYWRALRMWATSYSPSRAGVPDDYPYFGITACGERLVKGIVAIDRRYIPFYTRFYIPGYGFAYACDTGSGVKGRWVDLGYEDHNYEPWHQYVTVYFLTPVPPLDTIAWIIP
jgi:uncharacterized protein YabE (DUF348 family)